MLRPKDFSEIETRIGITRGIYHDGLSNVFCLAIQDTIIAQSYSAYGIAKVLADIQNMLATINNLYQLEHKAGGPK